MVCRVVAIAYYLYRFPIKYPLGMAIFEPCVVHCLCYQKYFRSFEPSYRFEVTLFCSFIQ